MTFFHPHSLGSAGAASCTLAFLTVSLLSPPAWADAPQQTSAYVRAADVSEPLVFRVPPGKTSRIAFEGDRILSAVYDKYELDLRTDSRQGQIFVRPLADTPAAVYLSTESGATVAVTLESDPKEDPQSITLRRAAGSAPYGTDTRSAAALSPMPAADYESALKRLVRHAALGQESADVMKRAACPQPSVSLRTALDRLGVLNPKLIGCWSSLTLQASAVRVKNSRLGSMTLHLQPLAGPTILAVGSEKTELPFGRSATIYFLETAHDGR